MRKGDWIQTYSGIKFYPLDPHLEDISIIDIAHALSNICRFTGQGSTFYSVAQHSVLVSQQVSKENALWGLLHDASEAYICGIARPIKKLPEMAPYRAIEKNLMDAIAITFGLPVDEPEEVRAADRVLLRTEARDLHLISSDWCCYSVVPLSIKIEPISPREAEGYFIKRFNELS
jgi:hypothetical protein